MTEYTLIRSDRRSLSLSIEPDGTVLVRSPRQLPQAEIDRFVASHERWIRIHRQQMQRRADFDKARFTDAEQIRHLIREAERILPEKTAYWAKRMGVTPTGVRITGAKTRFGSCSVRDSICYSYRLMAFPEDAIDYVVVHELAHIRHKNHSRDFYAFVARFLPDYPRREAMLRHREEKEN